MRTASTMSSSNYGNSKNQSNFGSRFSQSRSQIRIRDNISDFPYDHTHIITKQLKKLNEKEKEFESRSKDDELMIVKQHKKMYIKKYNNLIGGSNSLEKGYSMYDECLDRIEEDGFRDNFNAINIYGSPIKSLNDNPFEDLMSVSSDSKQQKLQDYLELIENNSINDNLIKIICGNQNERKKCMSQVGYNDLDQLISLDDPENNNDNDDDSSCCDDVNNYHCDIEIFSEENQYDKAHELDKRIDNVHSSDLWSEKSYPLPSNKSQGYNMQPLNTGSSVRQMNENTAMEVNSF